MNSKFSIHLAESKIHGKGVFTSEEIAAGKKIFDVGDIKKFINCDDYITPFGKMINHQRKGSCDLYRMGNFYSLYANRNIEAGEELTSDYTQAPTMFSRKIDGYKEL